MRWPTGQSLWSVKHDGDDCRQNRQKMNEYVHKNDSVFYAWVLFVQRFYDQRMCSHLKKNTSFIHLRNTNNYICCQLYMLPRVHTCLKAILLEEVTPDWLKASHIACKLGKQTWPGETRVTVWLNAATPLCLTIQPSNAHKANKMIWSGQPIPPNQD